MGAGTELIFVEGHSKDNTWAEIQRVAAAYPARKITIMQQAGKGKGDAVRLGFAAATGDLLMILDADLTMPPEELPKFYDVLASGHPLLALADSDSELAMMVAEERVGWIVPPNDREAFINRLLYLVDHRNELAEAALRARAVAERRYSLAQIGAQYRDLIASVVGQRHG